MLRVQELLINYQKECMALAEPPQFGWILESSRRNVIQEAYRLQIAKDQQFQAVVYDSGRVITEQSNHVRPVFPLQSASRYFVRVRVWNNAGEVCDSAISSFLTGIIDKALWKAAFVSAEPDVNGAVSNGNYVRKAINIQKDVRAAYAFTTALGLYHLWINGQRIGFEELSPGWTSYRKHLLYQTHDVTDALQGGENVVGAHIGAGWYKGEMGFAHHRNYYGSRTAFFCQILLQYEDGTSEWVYTDASWKQAASPVLFSEIYDGEQYDARLEKEGWSLPGYNDGAWESCEVLDFPKDCLAAQTGCAVKEMEDLPAKRLFRTPKGELCVDFGQNMAGWIEVQASGNAGDVIELRCFETLDAAGNVYTDNLRRAKQQISYRFGKTGSITYRPHFTYQGFRYAQILQFPGEVTAECFMAHALYSEMEATGTFSCSNPYLTRFHENVAWSLRSNFVDIPTDCPQRDERLGWTGDAQIFSRAACYLRNAYSFYAKWLVDVACDQTMEGGIPHVVPDIVTGHTEDDWLLRQGTDSAAAWADAAVIIPWTLYLQYGDTEIIRRQYDSMKAWIDFMWAHAQGSIWNYKLQFGDWVALDAEPGSYYGATPNDLTCTAYYAYSTGIFSKMAQAIGNDEDAERYQKLHRDIVESFRKTFFDADGNMTAQTQTAHILALHFDLVDPKLRQKTARRLRQLWEQEGGHLVTGFVGTPYFCHALSENGMTEEAYALLLKEDYPSWLYQVKMGATTVWEHWDGQKPDGTMWSADMNSFNHYAYGAVDEWVFRVLCGIDTDEGGPGFRHIVIAPRPGGGLSFAKGSYRSVYGTISVEWRIDGNTVTEMITIPPNTTATIRLHCAQEIVQADGLAFRPEKGEYKADAGSGTYQVTYRV